MTEEKKEEKKLGIKSWFYKDGQFSKTASFATIANFLVMVAYVMSWGAGSEVNVGEILSLKLPAFDAGAAAALLGILNGAYLGNNAVKHRAEGAKVA